MVTRRLAALAVELIALKLIVLVAGNVNSAIALVGTLPLVFPTASDPVEDGLVASFSRPGGNATGVQIFSATLVAKRLQLLHEMVPGVSVVGILTNPTSPTAPTQAKRAEAAAAAGMSIRIVGASSVSELNVAFDSLARQKTEGLAIGADPFFNSRSNQVIALAARHRLPTIYDWRKSTMAERRFVSGAC